MRLAWFCALVLIITTAHAQAPAGNVGIGVTNPVHFKLEVAGSIGPDATDGRNLGSALHRWDTLYARAVEATLYPSGFTPGGIVYAGSGGKLLQNSSQLYWDQTQHRMGIGVTAIPEGYRLAVAGGIIAEKLKLKLQAGGWPDYVFDPAYRLLSIDSLSAFIKQHRHLPGIPTAAEMERAGMDQAAVNVLLMQKTEELSLYIIQLHEAIAALKMKQEYVLPYCHENNHPVRTAAAFRQQGPCTMHSQQ